PADLRADEVILHVDVVVQLVVGAAVTAVGVIVSTGIPFGELSGVHEVVADVEVTHAARAVHREAQAAIVAAAAAVAARVVAAATAGIAAAAIRAAGRTIGVAHREADEVQLEVLSLE